MSVDWSIFPDAEKVSSLVLRDADVCSGRVYSAIPSKNAQFPLAVVKRLGGIPPVPRRLDQARIQVDVWGGTKSEARAAADAARVALHSAAGTTVTDADAFVTEVEDELGLTFLHDPETSRDRYTFAVLVYTHTTTE